MEGGAVAGSDVFTFDVTVQLEEGPSFDRACQQAKELADAEVEKYCESHESMSGEWLERESMEIVFRSYRQAWDGFRGSEYLYVFGVTVRFC